MPHNAEPPRPNCSAARRASKAPPKSSPLPERVGYQSTRLALATLFIPSNPCSGMQCGLLPWCSGARRLKAALPPTWSVSLVAVHPLPPKGEGGARPGAGWCASDATGRLPTGRDDARLEDCPELQLVAPSGKLRAAVRAFTARRQAQLPNKGAARWFARMAPTLFKWELMAKGAMYDAILFSDLDVDLSPPWLESAHVRAEWHQSLSRLRSKLNSAPSGARASVRLVASPDWSSPVNAGLMLLLPPPDLTIFLDGISILHAPFNVSHGFNLSGTPLDLFGSRKLRRTDDSILMHAGAPAIIDNSKWDFVGADVDQGFFLYMMHHYHDVGAYPSGSKHFVRHFWGGGPKPWHLILRDAHALNVKKGVCHIDHIRIFNYVRLLPVYNVVQLQHSTPCSRAFQEVLGELLAAQIMCCPNLHVTRPSPDQYLPGADFRPL
ncbi:hypothetical protein AB1Y20_006574 [Prymnesium parvum]|uniref:Protein xylosyltransferase n=1 Tax=Prymnesium parvum TaxID=97485 RepID=A0AB34J120_PRYPA|mmetsp:Transcript_21781/g.52346  ORF Transcript_21781/g.52346 Transcript_21781/m.52346 type:complete len:437 (-) Transcript_21781:54-1364(-)